MKMKLALVMIFALGVGSAHAWGKTLHETVAVQDRHAAGSFVSGHYSDAVQDRHTTGVKITFTAVQDRHASLSSQSDQPAQVIDLNQE